MKRSLHLFVALGTLCVGLLLGTPAQAEVPLAVVIAAVEQSYNGLNDLEASFSQKTNIPSMKREQVGGGTLAIKKRPGGPAMFRFDYTKPKQLIVSNGKMVWFYLPENRQVMETSVTDLFKGGNGVVLNYLTGIGRISKDFTITLFNGGRDQSGNYLLELIPKQPSQNLAKLQLTVSAEAVNYFAKTGKARTTFPIVTSVIFDPYGTRTAIAFSAIRVNRGLQNTLFTFRTPAGVEVVRQ
jgi:outer membrane lipoprotein carrier protein